MSSKAQKAYAKAVSLGGDTPEGRTFREGVERMGPMYYVDRDGRKRTMHGDILFDEPVKQDAKQTEPKSYEEPEPNSQAGPRVYPYSDAPSPEPERKDSTTSAQHSDPGTGPRRKGWVPPPSAPRKRTFKEFERWVSDNDARSVIRHRNKGLF